MKKIVFLLILAFSVTALARPGLLDSLGLGGDTESPPDVETVFHFSAEVKNGTTLLAHWQIAEGNYLYRNKLHLDIINTDQVRIDAYSLPPGINKEDAAFGLTEVYLHDISVPVSLIRQQRDPITIDLRVRYQGCSETFHICYPPVEKVLSLTLPALDATAQTHQPIPANTPLSQQDQLATHLAKGMSLSVLLSFFGLGLLLAFTPCVFPMIPILSSIIVGEGDNITPYKAFILSLSYVLAMSVTYTLAGVLTGLLGENLQALFQNPWVIGSFSMVFVLLALSMFGLYELQLPHALQQRLHHLSHRQRGGHVVGAILMGLLSGLIVGPCLAPPLAGALIFIGQQGDPFLGGIALFSLSLGMGLPLLVIGTSGGALLPKAGDWMDTIKAIFGVLMIGLAIWMLERILPGWVSLFLWGGLLIIIAVYLGACSTLAIDATGWQKLWKGVGLLLFIYGSLLLIGGASGQQSIWQPLARFASGHAAPISEVQFTRINSLAQLQQQLTQSQRPIVLDFYADWCVDCKRMAMTTFRDPDVVAALQSWNLLQVDMTQNTEQDKAILQHFSVFGPPTLLFFDARGQEYRTHRLIGEVTADKFLQHLASLPHSVSNRIAAPDSQTD